ncbi:RDD family protein [Nocardia africana]|uniref:RDD family n=1 Tax=Nocardia africana TaxID=134964 RepID=A0A378X5Z6_9NOCA|nr:RDD family protein [Nocardia africana]MCC3317231.1 RDD family protein [Nocardia africana]SUA47963.1 RDD family [Nocardia africana]
MSAPAHRTAGIVTRSIASGVDVAVVLALVAASYLCLAFARLLFSPQDFTWPDAGAVMSTGVFIVVSMLYLTGCWAVSGRTVGAVMMGLRVVTRGGELIGWPRALVRAVLCVMFAVGLFWVVVDPRRYSLQDIVLRTMVVYDWQPESRPPA